MTAMPPTNPPASLLAWQAQVAKPSAADLRGLLIGVSANVSIIMLVASVMSSLGLAGGGDRKVWGKGAAPRPSDLAVVSSIILFGFMLMEIDNTPLLGERAPNKPYADYGTFYAEAYTAAHVEPASRWGHLVIWFATFAIMSSERELFVTWLATLMAGALVTRPLLHDETPWTEAMVMTLVGSMISCRLGILLRYVGIYTAWLTLDYLDHVFLGHNGPSAIYVGKHYLSWALIGQGQLALTMAGELAALIRAQIVG